MVKDQEYLIKKASYCLDLAKKYGATNSGFPGGTRQNEAAITAITTEGY